MTGTISGRRAFVGSAIRAEVARRTRVDGCRRDTGQDVRDDGDAEVIRSGSPGRRSRERGG